MQYISQCYPLVINSGNSVKGKLRTNQMETIQGTKIISTNKSPPILSNSNGKQCGYKFLKDGYGHNENGSQLLNELLNRQQVFTHNLVLQHLLSVDIH